MQLRHYQTEAIQKTLETWKSKNSVLLHLATGTGKTILFSELCRMKANEGKRICIVVHLHILVKQIVDKILEIWQEPISIICSSLSSKKSSDSLITVCSIQSLFKFIEKNPECSFDYIIIDEAHHIPSRSIPSQYCTVLETLLNRNSELKILGVTATPYRMKEGKISGNEKSWFDSVTFSYDIKEAQKEKYLCMYDHRLPVDIRGDLKHIPTRNGEYARNPLSECMRSGVHLQTVIDSITKYAEGRKHIGVYTVDIPHAEAVTDILRANNITAACVHSKQRANEEIFAAFRDGQIRALVSVDMLTEGYDFPALDCLVVAAPTQSLSRHLQIIGRGLRPSPDKEDCLILDLAGNAFTHGTARNPIQKKNDHKMVIVSCPECQTVNAVFFGIPSTYYCTKCEEDLREVAGIEIRKRSQSKKKKEKEENTTIPLLPLMESDELRTLLKTQSSFPVTTYTCEKRYTAESEYLVVSVYSVYEEKLIASKFSIFFSSKFLPFLWGLYGTGPIPQCADEFLLAMKSKRFAMPTSVSFLVSDDNVVRIYFRKKRAKSIQKQEVIAKPAVQPSTGMRYTPVPTTSVIKRLHAR